MSRRDGSSVKTTRAATRAATRPATESRRLSQVLAAGLERKLSISTCLPCNQPKQAAATDLLLDYESEEQMREAGARFLEKRCPEDNRGCDAERDGLPIDPISYEEFEAAERNGRDRDATKVVILGCGHALTLETVQSFNQGRAVAMCPMLRSHRGGENGNYLLTATERDEIGFTPATDEIRYEDEDGDVFVYVNGADGEVLVRVELADGTIKFYEGPIGQERIVRIEYPDAENHFYEGSRGEERLVRLEDSGTNYYYEGESSMERLVRIEESNGDKYFFEGPKNHERQIRFENDEGKIIFYEGAMDEERKVLTITPDGYKIFHEGPKGQESIVRVVKD